MLKTPFGEHLSSLLPDQLGPQALEGLSNGILWKIIKNDPRLLTDPDVLKVAKILLGGGGKEPLTPVEVIVVLKVR